MSEVRIELKDGTVIVGKILKEDDDLIMIRTKVVVPLTILHKPIKIGEEVEVDDIRGVVKEIVDGGIIIESRYFIKKSDVRKVTVFKRFSKEK